MSPDGKWLAFVSDDSAGVSGGNVYIRRYPDGVDQSVSRDFALGPVWSADASELYFQGINNGELMLLAVAVSDTGNRPPRLTGLVLVQNLVWPTPDSDAP